jgi:hypothetical protein
MSAFLLQVRLCISVLDLGNQVFAIVKVPTLRLCLQGFIIQTARSLPSPCLLRTRNQEQGWQEHNHTVATDRVSGWLLIFFAFPPS